MKQWFTAAELAEAQLPGLPTTVRGINALADRNGWRSSSLARMEPSSGGRPGWTFSLDLLAVDQQVRLLALHSAPANQNANEAEQRRAELWARYEALSSEHKEDCETRLKALVYAQELIASGKLTGIKAAYKRAASKFDLSERSLYRWQSALQGYDRADWQAALARTMTVTAVRAECDQRAWDALISDFLRPEAPSFTACYRRMRAAAKKQGWSPVPSEQSLRRRANAEISKAVRVQARKGKEKGKQLYPAQRRTRDHFHAMQAVNMDGHKLDVRIDTGNGTVERYYLLGIQDLLSGKLLAWRLCPTENKETVRLVIGDMVETHGIPDSIYLDNGKAFASKWISGGSATRYRFKVREEEPEGLITALGIQLHWTLPYSGQSKPIERAWRDIAENVSRHPVCAGAYTGANTSSKPDNYACAVVPLNVLRELVAEQVAEHNARTGRRGGSCRGRSFDQTFADSLTQPSTIVRWASPAQRSLWLMAAESIRTQKGSGEIHLLGSRYWSAALNAHAGKPVTVRFDPDDLTKPVKVYDRTNSFICEAAAIGDTRFDDVHKAREHARARNDHRKAIAAEKRALAKLSAQDLAALYSRAEKAQAQADEPQPRPKVVRLARRGNLAVKPAEDDEFDANFGRAMEMIESASIHQFPRSAAEE